VAIPYACLWLLCHQGSAFNVNLCRKLIVIVADDNYYYNYYWLLMLHVCVFAGD